MRSPDTQSAPRTSAPPYPTLCCASVAMALEAARLPLPTLLALLGALLPGESRVEAAVEPTPGIWAAP